MASDTSAIEPTNQPLSPEARAAALWTFVQAKTPRFAYEDALDVVKQLQPHLRDDPKTLAKHLRKNLQQRGISFKHTHALHAASRLAGHASWHTNEDVHAARLRLVTFTSPYMTGVHEENFGSWDELTKRLRAWMDELHAQGQLPMDIVNVKFTGTAFNFTAPAKDPREPDGNRPYEWPLGSISSLVDGEWLQGAAASLEKLRRHLEERGKAVLDGSEVIHLCANQRPAPDRPNQVTLANAPNSELVLMREEEDMDPHSAYELARGDEVTCWHQLELAMRDDRTGELPTLDIHVPAEGAGAWLVNGDRYVWVLESLHPREFVPGRSMLFVGPNECERLLRRYRRAKRIHAQGFKYHALYKHLDYLSSPPDNYRVDLHFLLRQLNAAGLSWESYFTSHGEEVPAMEPVQPVGLVFQMLERLKVEDANKAFAMPNISQMQRVDDDGLIRALIPRIDSVRAVRPTGLTDEQKELLDETLKDFGAGRRIQIMTAGGSWHSEQETPYMFFSGDAGELVEVARELGLTMYAAVVPNLLPTKGILPSGDHAWPWALGNALFLRFVREGDVQ